MYNRGRECFLCGRNGAEDPLDLHHIFNGPYRKKSDRYGLTVYLCHDRCHENGRHAAHRDAETRQYLHEYGQQLAMEENGWTVADFIREFGKNYITEPETNGHELPRSSDMRDAILIRDIIDLDAPELPF